MGADPRGAGAGRPVDPADQWTVRWEDDPHGGPTEPTPAREALDAWRRGILAGERRAARGPETSGAWWSIPPASCLGTTGALPDWSRVAAEVDGVHVTLAGYLTTATRTLELGDGTACLLAGWDPDRTVWFTEAVRPVGPSVRWTWRDGDGPELGTFVRG